ncbi:MAG: MFS transporter [Chloroflexi bacterium]|nr:MFS transporter [Chloroflexota bacterium]
MQSTAQPSNWQTTVRILWITQFATMAAFSCSLPFVPLYILELGIPDPRQAALWAGFVAGGSGISMAIFSPIWGTVADRFGKKLMLERALVGAAITLLLMGLAQSAVQLLIFRVIQGSLTGTTSAVNALAASVAPREELGRVLSTMQMSIFAGSTVGPFVGGVLADTLGFRFAFTVTSVAMVLIGLVVFILVREPYQEKQSLPPLRLPQLRKPVGDGVLSTVFMLAPVIFLVQFAFMASRPIFPLFVADLAAADSSASFAGFSPQDYVATISGLLVATTGVVGAICSPITGRFINTYRVRLLLLIAVLGIAGANVGQAFAASFLQLWIVRVVLGAFGGVWAPTYSSTIGLSVPSERRGLAFGIANSASSLGNAIGPIVGGYVGAMLGIRAVFAGAAGVLLLAALWLVVRVTLPSSMESEE